MNDSTSSSSSDDDINYFDLSLRDLQVLMHQQGKIGVENIQSFGGVNQICELLHTSPEYGINSNKQELKLRLKTYGENYIEAKHNRRYYQFVLESFNDPTLIFLEVAATLSIILGLYITYVNKIGDKSEWIEGVVIFLSILVIVFVSATTDYQKEKQFRNLKKRLKDEQKISVIRDGHLIELCIEKLVVGDVCLIKYGNIIPADGIIIKSNDLKVDESSITGESKLVIKNIRIDAMLLSGTRVMEGNAKILITAVGINSQSGIIMRLIGLNDQSKHKKSKKKKSLKKKKSSLSEIENNNNNDNNNSADNIAENYDMDDENVRRSLAVDTMLELRESKTTEEMNSKIAIHDSLEDMLKTSEGSILQKKLYLITLQLTNFAIFAAILTVIILLISFIISFFQYDKKWNTTTDLLLIIRFFVIGLSILVVAIPEGLPLAVTLALAYSVRRMMADNNLVRNLVSCETMGNATTICSDKTGTITSNLMSCVEIYTCENISKIQRPITHIRNIILNPVLFLIIEGISINTSYTTYIEETYDGRKLYFGDKTECALLSLVLDFNGNYQSIRNLYPDSEFIHVFTFNSLRKSMSTILQKSKDRIRLYTKGGAEIVLNKCKYTFNRNGDVVELTSSTVEYLTSQVIDRMANNGLRTIILAYRDFLYEKPINDNEIYINEEPDWSNELDIVTNLTLICIFGIEDPVRPDVYEAIKLCKLAGITVRMITGDNLNTAKSIAFKCGIITNINDLDDPRVVMTGVEFNKYIRDENGNINQDLLDTIWPKLRVLARSRPVDKYILVKGIIETNLKNNSQVVAVTGDGTNDGPALKIADVGFAMGLSGTDVAKDSSDIILTDDNFSNIVKSLMWGRNVYDSITKFLQFQLTVNFVAVTVSIIGAIFEHDAILKAVQLLWVNLVMDALASLALATEKPTLKLLERKPYGRTQTLVSPIMFKNILTQSFYQLSVLILILILLHNEHDRLLDNDMYVSKASKLNSMIFNSLVMMTLFNEINCRKVHGEYNTFDGLLNNYFFILIWILSLIIQISVIQYGGIIFLTTPLNEVEWSYCVLFGLGTLLWFQLWTRIPIELWVINYYKKHCAKKNETDNADNDDNSDTNSMIGSGATRLLSQNHRNSLKNLYGQSDPNTPNTILK